MGFAVGPRAADTGHRLRVYERLDSTNSEAMRLAAGGETGPLWIVAQEQTAGRGRRGNEWISCQGNLAASLLLRVALAPEAAAALGFVAGLAVREACSAVADGVAFALKWPNDLLANGAKIAGLLLESEAQGAELAVVIGVGINVASAPEGLSYPAASLTGLGYPVTAESLFPRLTDAFVRYDSLWDRGRGFAQIRQLWLESAHGIGGPVSVRMGDRIEHGIFETLDGQGRLILRRSNADTIVISAGDVYFGDAATSATSSASGAAQ